MFELDVSLIPVMCDLIEDYKANNSLVITEDTMRSIVILSVRHKDSIEPKDLLNLKMALLLDPKSVMAVNNSRKTGHWESKERNEKERKIVIDIKEKLDITLQTIRELVLDANDNRFNVLPLELRYQVLHSLDADLAQIPSELWLPRNVDLAHLTRRDQQIDQALQDKQIKNTAVLSYHQFRRNNGCPDSITRLAIKDNQNLIKERLLAYMQQGKLPQQLNHHKRLLLVNAIGKEQSGTPRLTAKNVDQAIKAAAQKLEKHQAKLQDIQHKYALSTPRPAN